jgi:hypothetical protein
MRKALGLGQVRDGALHRAVFSCDLNQFCYRAYDLDDDAGGGPPALVPTSPRTARSTPAPGILAFSAAFATPVSSV